MSKKIAVIVRDRQSEALRMSLGLTLKDDVIDIFVLDRILERSKKTALNIETVKEMGIQIYSNVEQGKEMKFIPTAEMAEIFLNYDHTLPY